MKLFLSIKALGKKRAYIQKKAIELDVQANCKLKEILSLLVSMQVEEFNTKEPQQNLIQFLSEGQIEQVKHTGRMAFNESYNATKANLDSAIQNVLQAFEDGIIAVFINDYQLEHLEESIQLNTEDTLSIIRLSFLSGTLF